MKKREKILNKSFSIFHTFTRSEDEKRLVKGIASKEETDSYGDIVTYKAMKEAFDDYLGKKKDDGAYTYGNIREMHGDSAAGKVVKYDFKESKKETWIEVKVVDDQAWSKVKESVYSGFSIGGKIEKVEEIMKEFENEDGEVVERFTGWRITKIKLIEISLVDRPACPSALIDSYKKASKQSSFVPDLVYGELTDSPQKNIIKGESLDSSKILDLFIHNNSNMNFKTIWASLIKNFKKDDISLEYLEKNEATVEMTASEIYSLLKSVSESTFNEFKKNEEEEGENEDESDEEAKEKEEAEKEEAEKVKKAEQEKKEEEAKEKEEAEKVEKAAQAKLLKDISEKLEDVQKQNKKLADQNDVFAKKIDTLSKASSTQKGDDGDEGEDSDPDECFKGTVI